MNGKVLLMSVALCLMLGGCTAGNGEADGTGRPSDSDSQNSTAYELMISELQKELQTLREEQVRQNAAYEARIEELESMLETGAQSPSGSPSAAVFSHEERNGGVAITAYLGKNTRVEIPREINGKPVVEIGEGAFKNSAAVEIVVPEGVRTVGWFAFSGSYRLASVTLPASVACIEYGAFDLCSSSLRITCPKGSYAAQYAESYGIPTTLTNS